MRPTWLNDKHVLVKIFIICVFIYLFIYTVVQVQLSPFSPHQTPPPHPSTPPILKPTHLWLCACVLYMCSLMTLPLLSPSLLLSGYYQFVLYFNVSGWILLAYLFCWLGPTSLAIREMQIKTTMRYHFIPS